MRRSLILLGLLAAGCKGSSPAARCDALLSLICEREADCTLAGDRSQSRATLVADCRAVFDCPKVQSMTGPYEQCKNDIAASSCAMIRGHDRALVAFVLSSESPLPSCNRVIMR